MGGVPPYAPIGDRRRGSPYPPGCYSPIKDGKMRTGFRLVRTGKWLAMDFLKWLFSDNSSQYGEGASKVGRRCLSYAMPVVVFPPLTYSAGGWSLGVDGVSGYCFAVTIGQDSAPGFFSELMGFRDRKVACL